MLHSRARDFDRDFAIEPPGPTIDQVYEGQKAELATIIRRILDTSTPLDFDIQATARLMHNLAGTAAYFDDDHIGECAAKLEYPLRAAAGPDDVKLLCRTMLSVLS